MMDKTLDMLNKLAEYTDTSDTEDKDTQLFEESVSTIVNELWELGILINKLKNHSE